MAGVLQAAVGVPKRLIPRGQVRIRVRYKRYVTPWIDLLMVNKGELRQIVDGTGWALKETIDDERGLYVAILERT